MILSDITKVAIVIFAAPIYVYFVIRWISSAIFTSYFEAKRTYDK